MLLAINLVSRKSFENRLVKIFFFFLEVVLTEKFVKARNVDTKLVSRKIREKRNFTHFFVEISVKLQT